MDAFDEYEIEGKDNSEGEWSEGGEGGEDNMDLQAGFTDIDRVSRADDCGSFPVVKSGNLSEINKEIDQLTQDPIERFKRYVGAISHSMTEDGLYDISIDDRNKMCRMTSRLDNVKYLNATAYILGYVSTDGGKAINKKKIKEIFKAKLNDDSVKPPDIVRYARFWLELDTDI
jgi:hypothetical protein